MHLLESSVLSNEVESRIDLPVSAVAVEQDHVGANDTQLWVDVCGQGCGCRDGCRAGISEDGVVRIADVLGIGCAVVRSRVLPVHVGEQSEHEAEVDAGLSGEALLF